MNTWAKFLRDSPATLQRLIARHNRISLPRACPADARLCRLRAALIHQRTVGVTYFSLDAAAQTAVQDLRARRYRIRASELAQHYGPIRPLRDLAADPTPQSLSERLLLLGWLLPRPDPHHAAPSAYIMPRELRQWLPRPLTLETYGTVAPPPVAPAVQATAVLLIAASAQPLAVREDGLLRQSSLRHLQPRLGLPAAHNTDALLAFLLPLLYQLGLLERRDGCIHPTVAASRFLSRPLAEQQQRLHQTWIGQHQPDAWLRRWLIHDRGERGIDWPVLRRRLCTWAAALPPGQAVALDGLHDQLAAALGPLADAQTHGYRPVTRTPWGDARAATIFAAALRGPLCWLGLVVWKSGAGDQGSASADLVARVAPLDEVAPPDLAADGTLPSEQDAADPHSPPPDPQPWHYGPPGMLHIPHACPAAPLLRLLPFADWDATDTTHSTYRLTPGTLARAAGQGWSDTVLWRMLEEQAGPPPDGWKAELECQRSRIQLRYTGILLADDPALLTRAAAHRSVTRCLEARIAPGIALVPPEQLDTLTAALARQDIIVESTRDEAAPPPRLDSSTDLSAAHCAALLIASAFYRQHAPPDAPHLPHSDLDDRLRAALTPALRQAVDATMHNLPEPSDHTAEQVQARVAFAEQQARQADAQRATAERRAKDWERRARQAEAQQTACLPDPITVPPMPADNFWAPVAAAATQSTPETETRRNAAPAPEARTPAQPLLTPRALLPALAAVILVWWTLLPGLLSGLRLPRHRTATAPSERRHPSPSPSAPASLPAAPPAAVSSSEIRPPISEGIALLRRAIARRRTLEIVYDTGGRGSLDTRRIRPLLLEPHGPHWYLRAYCIRARAERTFRVDRLHHLTIVGGRPRRGDPEARQWNAGPPPEPAAPRPSTRRQRDADASFLRSMPEPGKPRVWLDDL